MTSSFPPLGDEPGPSGTEVVGGSGVELLLEFLEGTEAGFDRSGDVPTGVSATVARHDGPEDAVVRVAAAVVANHLLRGFIRHFADVADEIIDARVLLIQSLALDGRVQLVDIGLVVLRVVDLHRLGVYVRL